MLGQMPYLSTKSAQHTATPHEPRRFVYENRLTVQIETGSIRGHDSLIGNILHFYGARFDAKPRRGQPHLGLLPVSWKGGFQSR